MRGRLPSGPEYVEQLPGSELAKRRLQVILETMAGTCRVQEACTKLGISEQRFNQLRLQMLEAAMHSMEPGTPGRPSRKPSFTVEQVLQLQEQLALKEAELRAAQLRTEIALVMPHVVQPDRHAASTDSSAAPNDRPQQQGNDQADHTAVSSTDATSTDLHEKKTSPPPAANHRSKSRR